ncbi:MAG: AAA family ATPase, partial [Dolichospermum sp.]
KLSLIYSEHLVKVRRKILSDYNKKTTEYAENNPEKIEEYYNTIFTEYILRDNHFNSLELVTFIPAGRSFFANLQNNIFSFLSENIVIDYFLKEFGSAYERVKNSYHFRKLIHAFKLNDSIDELINQIIVGNYSYEKDQDWILYTNETNKNRRTNLSHSSSGQQEALPMTLILAILPFISSTTLFIIEEPEAHLFPTSQKHVISLISQVFNATEKKHKFIITTDSPYILTAFNNLIQAGNTLKALREKPEQNDLLKDLFKIVPESQILDINDVAAYTIKNGMIESLINEDNNLIDANIIDEVSNEFSQVFEKLIELELGE